MSLPNLPKVQALQTALHDKAKRSPSLRFYSLYDKVCRVDVLWVALKRSQLNDGAPGVAERNERPAIGTRAEARRRVRHSRRCCPISTCAGLCWAACVVFRRQHSAIRIG